MNTIEPKNIVNSNATHKRHLRPSVEYGINRGCNQFVSSKDLQSL